jgi:DNA modification methylase
MQLKKIKITDFEDYPLNYNEHPQNQIEELKKSIEQFGQVKNVVVWNGYFLAGHGFKTAALELGIKTLWAEDRSEWDKDKAEAYLIADNETARMAIRNDEILGQLLENRGDHVPGVDSEMLDGLLDDIGGDEMPIETEPPSVDKADELQQLWGVKTGDIWELKADGLKHLVLCGDCTDEAVIRELTGDEKKFNLGFTDPPYGINRSGGFDGFGGFGNPIARRTYDDKWDKKRPTKECFNLFISLSEVCLIFGGNFFADILPLGKHWLVWDKKNTMPTFGDCELVWTNVNRTSVKKYEFVYNGLIGKEKERYHPTQKPLQLICDIVSDYSDERDIAIDFFLGSGTTLIAAHQTGRQCRATEIEPKYVAVALQRFQDLTGQTPKLIKNIAK